MRFQSLLLAVIFLAAVIATGVSRLKCDDIQDSLEDKVRDLPYLPSGNTLKIIACGFDAPLADAFYVRGLVYFGAGAGGDSRAREVRHAYSFQLFDAATDLSPGFVRAYQLGALFLSATGEETMVNNAIKMLEKGIQAYDASLASGLPLDFDGRWLYHLYLGNLYETAIQSERIRQHDYFGASEARLKARDEYREAAQSPGAPSFVLASAAGFEASLVSGGNPQHSLSSILPMWKGLVEELAKRGDESLLAYAENRLSDAESRLQAIQATIYLEKELTKAQEAYVSKFGHEPKTIRDLVLEKILPGMPAKPMEIGHLWGDEKDQWLRLPNGEWRSAMLAQLTTNGALNYITDAITNYRRTHKGERPPNMEVLVKEKFLQEIPQPPLADLGQEYLYDAATGSVISSMPEGPMPSLE